MPASKTRAWQAAAAAAATAWRATPARQRSEVLRRWFQLMTDHAEALATLIALENGKALPDARGEVAYAAEFFRWVCRGSRPHPGRIPAYALGLATGSWSTTNPSASPC